MAVRLLSITHQDDVGAGVFADELKARNVEVVEWRPGRDAIPANDVGAAIVYGGAMNANQHEAYAWLTQEKALIASLLEARVPLLGVCLGSQLVAEAAGGSVRRATRPEIGWHSVEVTAAGADGPLIGPLAPHFVAFGWHSYEATLPENADPLAASAVCNQAYRIGERAWGIQFHAEVSERDALEWAADYRTDPDAVGMGLDPGALAADIRERIGAWNELGRALCGRFVDAASG